MDKKNFLFRPAELRKCADRWQIIFYTERPDAPGEFERHRETWEMNRISSIPERDKFAKKVLEKLNGKLLPNGYPYKSIEAIEKPGMLLPNAFKMAIAIKCRTPKTESIRTYKSVESIFMQFVEHEKLQHLSINAFSKKHVTAFSDYVTLVRACAGRTHNKYIVHVHCAWQELVSRELVEENVWSKAPRLKEDIVKRRVFTSDERAAVAAHLYRTDIWLFYWVVLQYYCFIRGTELRRLQFSDINLSEGYIYLSAQKTKNGKERYVTIPITIEHFFLDERFTVHPKNYLIFGEGLEPHAQKSVGGNTANRRHHIALEYLLKNELITDIKDLSIYSWKYTGISDDLNHKYLDISDAQHQAGHASPAQTMTYLRRPTVNNQIRASKKDIFSTST